MSLSPLSAWLTLRGRQKDRVAFVTPTSPGPGATRLSAKKRVSLNRKADAIVHALEHLTTAMNRSVHSLDLRLNRNAKIQMLNAEPKSSTAF